MKMLFRVSFLCLLIAVLVLPACSKSEPGGDDRSIIDRVSDASNGPAVPSAEPAPEEGAAVADAAAPVETAKPAEAGAPSEPVAPAAEEGVDEFGVPTGDVPPPIPPGYASEEEVLKAASGGKLKVFIPGAPIPLPEGVVETKDIEYGKGGDVSLKLDLYSVKDLAKPAPGLIFIHGGGWEAGQPEDYKYYTVRFAKRGYVVASIAYRLSDVAPFPAAVQDAKCAVRWMRANAENLNVDSNRIAVIGGSAGGYLSLMVGYTAGMPEFEGDGGWNDVSSAVQVVVDLYGPTDLTVPEARGVNVVEKFLGKKWDEDPDLYAKASPITHVKAGVPPTLVFQGTIDTLVPTSQSVALVEKLKEVGVPVVYEEYEGWPHTMDLALDINKRTQYMMLKFFEQHMGAQ